MMWRDAYHNFIREPLPENLRPEDAYGAASFLAGAKWFGKYLLESRRTEWGRGVPMTQADLRSELEKLNANP